ncbi:MAG TPA: DUF4340 domain-containing protein [Candidatus Polarisedimenticolia bacterium]|nr:DUF4340 domain-containing protein [Candidatus Polarisedimenticolia bacterium]
MRLRNTLAALLIFAGLAAFIYHYEYRGEAGREEAKRSEERALAFQTDRVKGIRIERKDGEPVELKREAGRWRLDRPFSTRADADKVASILSTLEFLRIEQTLDNVTEQERQDFNLAEPSARVVLQVAPEDPNGALEEKVLLLGDKAPLGSHHYAARPGSAEVMIVSGGADSILSHDAASLRYKKVVGIDTWKVARFRIEKGGDVLGLQREGDAWRLEAPISFPADASKVQGLWYDIQSAEAQSFESEAPSSSDLERLGLARPALTLVVEATEGAEPVRVAFGAPPGHDPVYARRSDMAAVMAVDRAVFEKLEQAAGEVEGFRDARVAPVDRYRLDRIELAAQGSETLTLEKDDESRWRNGGGEGGEVPSERVNALLDAVEELRATGFVDSPEPGAAGDPALRLTLREKTEEEQTTVTASLQPASGAGGAPRRFVSSAAASVYLVPPEKVASLEEAIRALSTPAEPAAGGAGSEAVP